MRGDLWFRRVSARPLAGLRVGLSLLLLLHLIWISDDLLSLHGSRGIVPWELTRLLRPPWVPGLPTLAKAFAPLGIGEHTAINLLLSGYAASLLSLALGLHARLSAFVAWGLHLGIVTSGFTSYYGVDQLANTFLFYLVVFPSGAQDRSGRLSEGHAGPPVRDLPRRRSRQGHGESVVEWRGDLADALSADLQHLRRRLACEPFLDSSARGMGNADRRDRLCVSRVATPNTQGVVHRDDRVAPGHLRVHGARLLLERDDSPHDLSLPDS